MDSGKIYWGAKYCPQVHVSSVTRYQLCMAVEVQPLGSQASTCPHQGQEEGQVSELLLLSLARHLKLQQSSGLCSPPACNWSALQPVWLLKRENASTGSLLSFDYNSLGLVKSRLFFPQTIQSISWISQELCWCLPLSIPSLNLPGFCGFMISGLFCRFFSSP